jgi:tRNA-dihydrouridine synthase 4
LVRKHGTDLVFTPMIISNSFCRSAKARASEFSTNRDDFPLIVQFASNNSVDFLHASEMVFPYSDGVDLNCGCPQRWAMQDGYGAFLLKKPDLIEDMVKTVRRNLPASYSVSMKIRLLSKRLLETIDFVRKMEALGITFLTVHGRTTAEKTSVPVDVNSVAEIKKSLKIPVIFNGDIQSLDDADRVHQETGCDGIMAARGMLTNPALFNGHKVTPLECVQDWLDIAHHQKENLQFQNFHHHLCFMLEKILEKPERVLFNEFTKRSQVLDFLSEKWDLQPKSIDFPSNFDCSFDDSNYRRATDSDAILNEYSSENTLGKFFFSKLQKTKNDTSDYSDFMDDCNIFQ